MVSKNGQVKWSGKMKVECISFWVNNLQVFIERRYIVCMTSISHIHSKQAIKAIEDILALATSQDQVQQKKSILAINIGNGQLNIEVNEPVEIMAIKAENICPLPLFIASRINLPCVRALAITDKGIAIIIDPLKIIE